jgi:hypothetical protein
MHTKPLRLQISQRKSQTALQSVTMTQKKTVTTVHCAVVCKMDALEGKKLE